MAQASRGYRSGADDESGHRRRSCVGNATVTMRFVWKYPRLPPAVPKMPTLLDGAASPGKTNISKYETRSSESAGLD
jgi:hypothetical protein